MTFEQACLSDATVANAIKAGLPTPEIVALLVAEKNSLLRRVIELDAIAPRKIVVNGKKYIWRCPDELVPEQK